jgi:hypothetical protein
VPKLTLNADKDVIAKAKKIADERGISVSTMFRQFIEMLGSRRPKRQRTAPITRRLRGLAKVSPDRSDRQLFEDAVQKKSR